MSIQRIILAANALILAIPVVIPIEVSAQDELDTIEEIVVTARRREESIQNVPISIVAMDLQDLELRGITELEDLTAMVPNVIFIGSELTGPSTGGSDPARYAIRGLPGVGVYVDGIWDANNTNSLTSNIIDVERIEVMRGPQGTLFGKNTMGGAVQIITARPADDFGARAALTVGDFDRRDVNVRVDIPLGEYFKTRWTVASLNRRGYLTSAVTGRDFGDTNQTVVRGDLLWKPADSFSARLILENDQMDQNGIPRLTHGISGAGTFPPAAGSRCAAACAYNIVAQDPTSTSGIIAITNDTHVSGFPGGSLGEFETRMVQTLNGFVQDADRLTLDLTWDINDSMRIRSLTGYRETLRHLALDFEGLEYNMLQQNQVHEDEQTTQEIQLLGSHGRVNWVIGGFYWDEESTEYQMRYAFQEFEGQSPAGIGGNSCDPATGIYARVQPTGDFAIVNAAVPCYGFIPSSPSLELHGSDGIAFFGEATIDFSDAFSLTVGIRQTDETKIEARMAPLPQPSTPNEYPTFDPFVIGFHPLADSDGFFLNEQADFDKTTGRISLQYRWSDAGMGYVTYSEGFNAGRINSYYFPFFNPGFPLPIEAEEVENIEVGIKTDLAGGRVRLNAAIFTNDFTNLHAPITTLDGNGNPVPLQTTLNVGTASADGAELDVIWLLSNSWRADFSIAFLDTNYETLVLPDDSTLAVGFGTEFFTLDTPFPLAPETSFTLGLQNTADLGNGGNVTSRLSYGWNDDYRMHPNDAVAVVQEAYGLLNLRVAYNAPDDKYRVTFFGDNLTDEYYLLSGFSTENLGIALNTVGRPRQIGVEIQVLID